MTKKDEEKKYSPTVTITLRKAITVNGAETKTLTMREPNFEDNASVEKIASPIERERIMFSSLCNLTPDEVGQLSMYDGAQLAKAYNDFL